MFNSWKNIWLIISLNIFLLLICSSFRHLLYQSTALDLGIFDQAIYLISQGLDPISSFLGFHILGDHAAIILYPLSLLYKIYPTVYWLLLVQAVSLSLAAFPIVCIAELSGLTTKQAITIAVVYLLHPTFFKVNLFDFHPEVIAVPAFLWSVLSVYMGRQINFCLAIIIILSCKAILSLNIVAMGIWLLFTDKRRYYGITATILGLIWFIVSTQIIVPSYSGTINRHLGLYSHLGDSYLNIMVNSIAQPALPLSSIFNIQSLIYLFILVLPISHLFLICQYHIGYKVLVSLLPAIPTLAMNLLSNHFVQKDLSYHYTLPIMPFLFVAVISALARWRHFNQRQINIIMVCSLAFFILVAKPELGLLGKRYFVALDTWQASYTAIARIPSTASVLTTDWLAPHLTHRPQIKIITEQPLETNYLEEFDYVLVNIRHPGLLTSTRQQEKIVEILANEQRFKQEYQSNDVYLFVNTNRLL